MSEKKFNPNNCSDDCMHNGICDGSCTNKYETVGKVSFDLDNNTKTFTPDTPTDQWQKEAEEIVNDEYSAWTRGGCVPPDIQIEMKAYKSGVIRGIELSHSEHTAHLAQLQGEIDRLLDEQKNAVSGYGLIEIENKLRNITKTK